MRKRISDKNQTLSIQILLCILENGFKQYPSVAYCPEVPQDSYKHGAIENPNQNTMILRCVYVYMCVCLCACLYVHAHVWC